MTNELSARLNGYLAARSPRERQTLVAGGLILLVLLGYGGIYDPLSQARAKLANRLPMQRAELRLMRVQAAQIDRLRARGSGQGTLEQRIKASAAAFGLVGSFKQFTPLAQEQIQLSTKPLATTSWNDWLGDLEKQGISIVRCRISATQPGMASLDLTLQGAQ